MRYNPWIPRYLAVAAWLAACPCSLTAARAEHTAVAGPTDRIRAVKLEGIEGFGYVAEVTPQLLRGSQPTRRGVAWLKQRGVKTVINLRHFHGQGEREQVQAAGMRYEHIPLRASEPPQAEQIAHFLRLVNDPRQVPVFVHCAQGVDRTGTMLAVYRMEVQGWSNTEALAEMLSFGAHRIWRDLRGFVRGYRAAGSTRAP